MNSKLKELISRLEEADNSCLHLLVKVSHDPKTNWWIRKDYLLHRPLKIINIQVYEKKGHSIPERAWLSWSDLRRLIEMELMRMKDPQDKRLLQERNLMKFRSPTVPAVQWLMDHAGDNEVSDETRYENVINWVARPELYFCGTRPSGSTVFRKLRTDLKGEPELMKRSLTFAMTSNPEYPLYTSQEGISWKIRVNEFPELPLYTLLINNKQEADFDNWPKKWKRPNVQLDLTQDGTLPGFSPLR